MSEWQVRIMSMCVDKYFWKFNIWSDPEKQGSWRGHSGINRMFKKTGKGMLAYWRNDEMKG